LEFFELLGCFFGSLAFALLLNAPKNARLPAALIALVGYAVYKGILIFSTSEMAGYFFAAAVITVACELLARFMKCPTTVFLTVAIIPLVPGLGIYQTMICVLQSDYNGFMQMGTYTLMSVCALAIAIALCSQVFRLFAKRRQNNMVNED